MLGGPRNHHLYGLGAELALQFPSILRHRTFLRRLIFIDHVIQAGGRSLESGIAVESAEWVLG